MTEAVVALGSNIGNKKENLEKAINALKLLPMTEVKKVSKFYENPPFDVPDKQNYYVNCCTLLKTELSPKALLGACLGIESAMGRRREYKHAPRILDIDLLLYGNERENTTELTIPHPKIEERAFVLVPLKDLCENERFFNFDFSKAIKSIDKSKLKSV